ncbi:MAG: hypothetical protein HYS04_01690 [Acidobacteria bacterium]|nr:hypothetical protein [Acidobacteriota bacterium]
MRSFTSLFLIFFFCVTGIAVAQTPTIVNCSITSVPPLVHAEGLAERLGDILASCTGTPNGSLTGNMGLFLNANITNKLSPQGFADVILTIDAGGGPVPANVSAQPSGLNSVFWNGLTIPVPADGKVSFRISNLRGAVNQANTTFFQPLTATISFNPTGLLNFTHTFLTVGTPERGLFGSVLSTLRCGPQGSPLPDVITFSNLVAAGSGFATLRITEGFAHSFHPREPLADNGVRIVVRYGNLPAAARLFVPDVIVGSTGLAPTSAGDFGLPPSGGQVGPTGSALLLVRVRGTDANGAGGTLIAVPPVGPATTTFDSASEVELAGGSGIAVFEVVGANPAIVEFATIPTFLGLPAGAVQQTVVTTMQMSLGPVSTVATASATAPVPRFAAVPPPPDCTLLRDCDAAYLPRLLVDPDPLQLTLPQGSAYQVRYVRVVNQGGGLMTWSTSTVYRSGSGWLRADPESGSRNATIRLDFTPGTLTPGLYEASLVIDAGLAGTRTIPLSLTITPRPIEPPARAEIRAVTNAATFRPGPLVRGSFGTINGVRFSGRELSVTFDGMAARVVFANDQQINVLVPAELGTRATAQVVVTVDGVASQPFTVALADAAPGIFNPGVLNQDNSVNSATAPALVGSVIQVFATGVMPPEIFGVIGPPPIPGDGVEAKLHDRILVPLYAGPAPGIPGLQQINLAVPGDLPAMRTEVLVCSTIGGQKTCSLPATIFLRQ